MDIAFIKPKQAIPRFQKDEDWKKKTVMYYKSACQPAVDKAEAIKMYRLANGELDDTEYLHVTNPINSTRVELQGYPAKLKNYDIISPNINLMLGEKSKRFFSPIVYAKNTDHQSRALEEEQRLLVQELQKMFINEVHALGVPVEKEQIQQGLQGIQQRIKNLPDELSEMGQLGIEYIIDYNDMIRYFRKGFFDYLCTSNVISYRDIFKSKTYYDIISSIHFSYLMSPSKDFYEDGEACKADHFMSLNEVYDRFQSLGKEGGFTEELEQFLLRNSNTQVTGLRDEYYYAGNDMIAAENELFRNTFGYLPEERFSQGVIVSHVNWRSQCKMGKVTKSTLLGETEVYYVSEDYKVTDGETIEWEWVDEAWEGYCIGDMYYLGMRPIPIQRGEFNDPHKCKLLYNGRKSTSRHTTPISIVKKGESYQKSVNIIKYRAEESLAKNLDKVILFPLGLIPKKEGWDEAKLMYYVRAFSFLFYDDTRPNISQLVQGMKELNMSMADHILKSYELARTFKLEWDEVCGINQQRKGQIIQSAGKGVTQDAVAFSSVMSEELYLTYEEFERRDYTCMLEYSKYAFSDGFQSHFIRLDGQKAFLNIHDPSKYVYSDLGVFVKNGAKEQQRLEMLRANVQSFVQNQMMPGAITKVIESDNFAELHKVMDEVDAKLEARFQQEQETQKEVQASKERIAKEDRDFDYYDSNVKAQATIQVALIKEGMQVADDLRMAEESGNKEAVGIAQDKLEQNAIALLQNATKLKEMASKERIAKHKDETALKNKTVGEK